MTLRFTIRTRREDEVQLAYIACLRAIHDEQRKLSEVEAAELFGRLASHCESYMETLHTPHAPPVIP